MWFNDHRVRNTEIAMHQETVTSYQCSLWNAAMQARNVGFTDDDLDQGAIGKGPRRLACRFLPEGRTFLIRQGGMAHLREAEGPASSCPSSSPIPDPGPVTPVCGSSYVFFFVLLSLSRFLALSLSRFLSLISLCVHTCGEGEIEREIETW